MEDQDLTCGYGIQYKGHTSMMAKYPANTK